MENNFNLNIQDMERAGLQIGHRVSKLHPKMKPYLAGIKNTIHIINLEETIQKIKEALEFIDKTISEGKTILLVGTKIPIKNLIKEIAQECGLPYVNKRWLGGTFTNFETILQRINYFKELVRQQEIGALEKYTKKERMKMEKEIEALRDKFEGLKDISKLPEVVFIFDMKKDALAAKEARKKGIKIIAICDTNINPDLTDYPIPANDDAISAVKYILEKTKEVVLKAKSKAQITNEKLNSKS